MSRYSMRLMILLTAGLLAVACGDEASEVSGTDQTGPAVRFVESPEVHGWVEIALTDAPPTAVHPGETCTWFLFEAGHLLRHDLAGGEWSTYRLEDIQGGVEGFTVAGDNPVLLAGGSVLTLDAHSGEVRVERLPDGIDPVMIGVFNDAVAVVDRQGDIAIESEDGFEVHPAPRALNPYGDIVVTGPDMAFQLEEGGIALYDPSQGLWQFEESPSGDVLASLDNELFMGVGNAVLHRAEPARWDTVAEGHLYSGGLLLAESGVGSPQDGGESVAERPSFLPTILSGSPGNEEPLWAVDELGLAAYAPLGTVDSRLSLYQVERISCSLAGQEPEERGAEASVNEMITAASGAFRIYESVSTRPDPFEEFSLESRDIRRSVEDISIEELRLVGITLDPTAGDQALAEDGNGVAFVLYEGTELKNNTHVAEITANEVIIIQDVVVDYTATGGGVTTIPTIYSMRLHEEGGL